MLLFFDDTTQEVDLSNVEFNNPEKHNKYYNVDTMEDLLLKVENCNVDLENHTLTLNEKTLLFINQFEEFCLKLSSANFKKWFNKNSTFEKLSKLLEKIEKDDVCHIEVNEYSVFDENDICFVNNQEIDKDENVNVILKFNGIKLFSKKIKCSWKLHQIKKNMNLIDLSKKSLF